MWLQATIAEEDLTKLLDQALPLELNLAGEGEPEKSLQLDSPAHLDFVPSVGIRVKLSGRIVWPVLGINVPANVKSASALVTPFIETEGEPALAFGVKLEHLDVSLVPGLVESAIVEVVNQELARPGKLPRWHFTRTLDFRWSLAKALKIDADALLGASWAELKITDEGITLAMSFHASVDKKQRIGEAPARDTVDDRGQRDTQHDPLPPRMSDPNARG